MMKEKLERCVVCGQSSTFRFNPTVITPQLKEVWGLSDELVEAFNRKESMFCSNCGSSLRIRRLCTVLIRTFLEISGRSYTSFVELLRDQEFRHLRIAEINDLGSLHSYLKEHPNLRYSEYMPHIKPGETHEGIRCEDLQRLTYPDDYFDIILTSETLEHVPDPDKAWREIYRTLKVRGYHIFTIPVIPSRSSTIQRARLVKGRHEHLLEPAYHGGWGQEDMFVYTDFGMDVIEKLSQMGLNTEVFYLNPEDELDVAVVFRSQKWKEHIVATPAEDQPFSTKANGRSFVQCDTPNLGITESISSNFEVTGWAISEDGIAKIFVEIDDALVGLATYGSFRPDIAVHHPDIPGSDKSGFRCPIDISNLKSGKHHLRIRAVAENGQATEVSGFFIVDKSSMTQLLTEERIIPDSVKGLPIYFEHISRYIFASNNVVGKRVLDAACGVGYGSQILAFQAPQQVVGVDLSLAALHHANNYYWKKGTLFFANADVETLPFPDKFFDIVVGFEIIEHLQQPERFLQEVHRVLTEDGLFFVSTPNVVVYKAGDTPNPYHVREFSFKEFMLFLEDYFPYVEIFSQNHFAGQVFKRAGSQAEMGLAQVDTSVLEGRAQPLYFLGVCAKTKFQLADQLLVQSHHSYYWRDAELAKLQADCQVKTSEIEQLQGVVQVREAEVTRLTGEVERLQEVAKTRQAEVAQLQESVQAREEEVSRLTGDVERLQEVAKAREAEVAQLQESIQAREAEVARLTGDVERLQEVAKAREVEVAQLQESVQAREAEVARLTGEVERLQEVAKAREVEVAQLQESVQARKAEVARLTGDVERLQEVAKAREEENTRLLGRLDEQTEELRQTHLLVSSIEQSAGWKLFQRLLHVLEWVLPANSRRGRLSLLMRRALLVWLDEGLGALIARIFAKGKSGLSRRLLLACDEPNLLAKEVVFGSVVIRGWALARSGIDKIEIHVDNQLIGLAKYGDSRPDVAMYYPNFNEAEQSGFSFEWDSTRVTDGEHHLLLRAISQEGYAQDLAGHIIVDNTTSPPKAQDLVMAIDTKIPDTLVVGKGNALYLSGWCYHPDHRISKLQVVANNVAHPVRIWGVARPDVRDAHFPELDPQGHSHYSGFAAIVPFPENQSGTNAELYLKATLRNGAICQKKIATITLKHTLVRDENSHLVKLPKSGEQPAIAICMTTYNPPIPLFSRQIQSILNQTYQNWICIISDDCSRPEILEQIRQTISQDKRFYLSRASSRLGFYYNFERCLSLVPEGVDFVAISNHDDYWHPDKLQTLLAHFDEDTTLVYSDMNIVDEKGHLLSNTYWTTRPNNYQNLASLLIANCITGAASMFRSNLLSYVLPFPVRIGDSFHDHWISSVAMAAGKVDYIDRPLYDYVQHGASVLGHYAPRKVSVAKKIFLLRGFSRMSTEKNPPHIPWQSIYFSDVMRLQLTACILKLRCDHMLSIDKRKTIQRIRDADKSFLVSIWLWLRGLKNFVSTSETLGTEYHLLRGILWKRYITLGRGLKQ